LVKRSATSGRAFLTAAASNLAACTGFQVIRYSPARSSSESPITALMASLMPSASAWASSIKACSCLSYRTFLSISLVLMFYSSLCWGYELPSFCRSWSRSRRARPSIRLKSALADACQLFPPLLLLFFCERCRCPRRIDTYPPLRDGVVGGPSLVTDPRHYALLGPLLGQLVQFAPQCP